METLIYQTYSVCPICVLIQKKGMRWMDAKVVQKEEKIYLNTSCKAHGKQSILYFANAKFFHKCLKFSTEPVKKTADIEDLRSKTNYTLKSENYPLMAELSVHQGSSFLTDESIVKDIKSIKAVYPQDRKYVVKVLAKLAVDMEELNKKIIFVQSNFPQMIILVEASFERLILLSSLRDSAFFHPLVYPALKYFLRQGDEELCCSELNQLFTAMKEFKEINLLVTIAIDKPFPNLGPVLSLLQSQKSLVRFINLSFERSPKDVLTKILKKSDHINKSEDKEKPLTEEDVDPCEILELISTATNKKITPDDFFPTSIAVVLEPLLSLIGYGHYCLRPSPLCGFVSILVNSGPYESYPANRLVDFHKFFTEFVPMIPSLKGGLGWFSGGKIKKIMSKSVQSGVNLPDLYSYLADRDKADTTRRVISQMQFLMVHNHMDISSVDMTRRCQCAVVTPTVITSNGIAASCTGCI
eukprot:TRINITY_DN2540_c0_g1_i1.p1 TRINITY_DN2540_c0_g1~~TRINITY_DN2540_c0_g1_i1.p1  ORF type:complete len:482 (+),score=90.93 TRINITY_DN2540_c0_g1_i1:41-1447(+)